ncbi:Tryptophan--tRNA ligase [Candidatus Hepatincolaceae symbiont of Richtersius coronifer]
MKTIFSGIQPTGTIHLGNYIGAINNWCNLQKANNINLYCIVDLHAITVHHDPALLKRNTLELITWLLACGIDPDKSIMFTQSSNSHHTELGWLLNCVARIGWVNRMTQFKDKAGNNREKSSVGLYTYPVLQAADILLYNTDLVPVGEDQKQHVELCRDIALKFNHDYGNFFKIPEYVSIPNQARIMSLRDGSKKMSKSDPAVSAKILFSDSNEEIEQKIKKATTDSLNIPTTIEEAASRPEIYNLLNIYAFCARTSLADVINQFSGQGFSGFKNLLSAALINLIQPIRAKQIDLWENQDYILNILQKGKEQAVSLSTPNIKAIKKILGFINP